MLDKLILLLDKHDMVIDGGNEWYKNTERRILRCKQSGIRYSGMGISGGERGALTHPCLMFGGNLEDYNELKRILSQVDTVSLIFIEFLGFLRWTWLLRPLRKNGPQRHGIRPNASNFRIIQADEV